MRWHRSYRQMRWAASPVAKAEWQCLPRFGPGFSTHFSGKFPPPAFSADIRDIGRKYWLYFLRFRQIRCLCGPAGSGNWSAHRSCKYSRWWRNRICGFDRRCPHTPSGDQSVQSAPGHPYREYQERSGRRTALWSVSCSCPTGVLLLSEKSWYSNRMLSAARRWSARTLPYKIFLRLRSWTADSWWYRLFCSSVFRSPEGHNRILSQAQKSFLSVLLPRRLFRSAPWKLLLYWCPAYLPGPAWILIFSLPCYQQPLYLFLNLCLDVNIF